MRSVYSLTRILWILCREQAESARFSNFLSKWDDSGEPRPDGSASRLYRFGIVKQMEDIGANLRWITIPALLPVAVNLPGGTRKSMPLPGAPLANGRMRVSETLVGAEVHGRCHSASRRL